MLCYVTSHQRPVTTEQHEHVYALCPIAKQIGPTVPHQSKKSRSMESPSNAILNTVRPITEY